MAIWNYNATMPPYYSILNGEVRKFARFAPNLLDEGHSAIICGIVLLKIGKECEYRP